ncbi:MAG: imidazolonepropionase [Phycisphaerae bacterium]|nr:imidazolonepropionase [Phycisphaerae bacterium]MBT6282412.1 imidazolonepropionase [Phycisphaerae bacterium]
MSSFIIVNARILTLAGENAPRKKEVMNDLGIIQNGFIAVKDGIIEFIAEGLPDEDFINSHPDVPVVDANGRVVLPSFVDCHTHACWAGSRLEEFELGLRGTSYLEILEQGGGIMSTVRAVRESSQEDLCIDVLGRLGLMASLGTTTIEIKSGYGLTTESELKMLRAIHDASQDVPQIIVGTFLGAHAIDPEQENFTDIVIHETLPAVVQEFPNITCDAYCEQGAWSLDETTKLFKKAIELNCPIRAHVDQFNSLGMLARAVELGARSVDHLEHSTNEELKLLAESNTIGVLLPTSGFCLHDRYARGREIIDLGCAVAIATNYNPGSAPSPSMPFAISLACRRLGLTPAEAITAATINAACVLNLQDKVGSLEIGKHADLQLLECDDERDLAWHIAAGGPLLVSIKGEIVHLLTDGEMEIEDES